MKTHLNDLEENTGKSGHTFEFFRSVLALIVLLGIVMVYSSSYIYAKETLGSSTYFIFRHIVFCVVGLVGAGILAKTKLKFWLKTALITNAIVIVLLALTFVPTLGINLNGAHRWINLGLFKFQPSELIKYTLLLVSINFFENFETLGPKQRGIYIFSMISPVGLLLFQPDFGSLSISVATMLFVGFISKFPRKLFYSILGLGSMSIIGLIFSAPYRIQRVLTYLDPWKDPKNSGFQIIQSYLAFAHGSLFGQGVGNSSEKLFYLPEAYNDFIFSVIGEELGFVGVVFVITLFVVLTYLGHKLAIKQKAAISKLLIAGVTFLITFQAFLNMGVVLGILPTKGLNLPFISYGGTSLVMNLLGVGLIASALKYDGEGFNREKQKFVKKQFSGQFPHRMHKPINKDFV